MDDMIMIMIPEYNRYSYYNVMSCQSCSQLFDSPPPRTWYTCYLVNFPESEEIPRRGGEQRGSGERARYPTKALSLNIPLASGSGSGREGAGNLASSSAQQPIIVDCIKQRRWRGDVFRTVVVRTPPQFSRATKGAARSKCT